MEVYTEFQGKNIVFKLVGELDEHSAAFVRKRLDDAMQNNNFDNAILDLGNLSFMDSTGIGVAHGGQNFQNVGLVRNNFPRIIRNFSQR